MVSCLAPNEKSPRSPNENEYELGPMHEGLIAILSYILEMRQVSPVVIGKAGVQAGIEDYASELCSALAPSGVGSLLSSAGHHGSAFEQKKLGWFWRFLS